MNRKMKIPIGLLSALLAFVFPIFANTDYYVDVKIGNDLNNGLALTAAWKTLKPASEKAVAGDTVYIRAGTYSTESDQYHAIIHPKNSGAPGNYITFTNYGNESVVLNGVYQPVLLAYPATNYIKIDGLRIDGGSQSTSAIDTFALIQGSHNIIQNCVMQYLSFSSGGAKGIHIIAGSSYNQIINNTIRYVGKNEQPTGDNIGEGIWVEGEHNLIEYNDISYCGHNCLLLRGRYNIARRNVLHGHIGRTSEIHSAGTENCHLVFDSNVIRDSGGLTPGNCPGNGLQADAAYQIIRRNEFYNNYGHGAGIWGMASSSGVPMHTRFYHNVTFKNGLNSAIPNFPVYGLELNQIGEPTPGAFHDVVMKNNIIYKNQRVGINYKPSQTDPNDHVDTNNHKDTNGSPGFVSESAFNFQLTAGSPCINAGAFLTQTTSSGSGTKIPVGDAGYFIDGFGIVEGDLIQLQWQTQTARITAVDYANNTITVSQSLSWSSGQGVSLAYEGSAPDIGAYEYRPTVPLAASAAASPTSGSAPLTVSFTGGASGGSSPYTYSWSFGDGQTSASQNPSHIYTATGSYTATLTVTDSRSNQDSASMSITITSQASAIVAGIMASPASGQAPLTVSFTGSASGGTAPYTFNWNFGDGQTSASQNPSHTYTTAGTYTAMLTVTDSRSTQSSATITITASAGTSEITAGIIASPGSGQAPLAVSFTGSASGGTAPYTFNWNFGDGQTSASQNPSHTYTTAGTYTAMLTVTDSRSTQSSATIAITVSARASEITTGIVASPGSGQAPLAVSFTGSASGGTAPYTFNWNFGDGQNSSGQNAAHAYTTAGNYTVTLTLTDSRGSMNSATTLVEVSPVYVPPLSASIAASPTSGRPPLTVGFAANVSGGTPPYAFRWDFGDGQVSTDQNPTHTYNAVGYYYITCIVSDGQGASISSSLNIKAGNGKKPNLSAGPKRLLLQVSKSSPVNKPHFFGILKSGAGPLPWTINCTAPWLSCSPNAGMNSRRVQVMVNPSDLEPGLYSTTISVAAPSALRPMQNISIILRVKN